jgi:hypothetical protein
MKRLENLRRFSRFKQIKAPGYLKDQFSFSIQNFSMLSLKRRRNQNNKPMS